MTLCIYRRTVIPKIFTETVILYPASFVDFSLTFDCVINVRTQGKIWQKANVKWLSEYFSW